MNSDTHISMPFNNHSQRSRLLVYLVRITTWLCFAPSSFIKYTLASTFRLYPRSSVQWPLVLYVYSD